jgi:hypothetical protein
VFQPNRRQRGILILIVVNILLLCLAVFWSLSSATRDVAVAVAKSKQMMDMNMMAAPALDVQSVEQIALADEELQSLIDDDELQFINAVRMSHGEARYWQDAGCGGQNCAHVTFYNYADAGTVEAIVNLEKAEVVGRWTDSEARPAGSSHVMPKAMAIAAADDAVQAILGDIGEADPAMIPMSGWLMDDACSDEWCVDLTFHDPNGSGRIFHVFVNMQQEQVARTFYTRGREDRTAAKPLAQGTAYTDGCHEQYGWEVCWEMTASDGINFRDATYNDQLIFSSAKIGQVEAWYPSWPGGYRDEIGFAASVPPVGDTQVEDLDDSFEVRQIFTEFTSWPNCICCYRYEQIIRFYEDGRLEFRFISHGPGCDDLSVYRPFWRIDVDLDGPENDGVWLWEDTSWAEAFTEFETYPVVDDISPDGHKLATYDEDLHYRWFMEKTDPLGLDEGYLFLLQFNKDEGAGPITTGPGDTFIPPRQWIDGDPLSGENIVLWFVPLLNQKRGGPYWCIPDPEPAFSPCDAVLHAQPAEELRQPTLEELATLEPKSTPDLMVTPTPTMIPAPSATPRPLEGVDPEEILNNAGCTSCHQIGELGEAHKVGPDLSRIGLLDSQALYNMPLDEYIRQSIVDPNTILTPNCPNGPCLPNIMPRDYATRLDNQQVEILVQHLLEQQADEPILTAPELAENTDSTFSPKAFPAPKNARRIVPEPSLASTIVVLILLFSLILLLGLLLYFKGSADDSSPN